MRVDIDSENRKVEQRVLGSSIGHIRQESSKKAKERINKDKFCLGNATMKLNSL